MGLFSACYGGCTRHFVDKKAAQAQLGAAVENSHLCNGLEEAVAAAVFETEQLIKFRLRFFSSCLSIVVGVLWLTLTGLGILEEVLP